jgi:hypothetical protein
VLAAALLAALVAFSGMVRDPDTSLEYTEPGMNLDVNYRQTDRRAATS